MVIIPRLTVEDVREIFERVRNNRPSPPHLPFQVVNVPVPANGARFLPPPSEFQDGIYVLSDKPNYPSNLYEDVKLDPPSARCQWTTHGPRLTQPTDFQQRSCCPRDATTEYGRSKRGDIWTMLSADGTDNLEYRIFHVFPLFLPTKSLPVKKQPSLSSLHLSLEDVRDIFESVHNNVPPPPRLSFKVVPVGPDNGAPVSPPQYTFDDGLYILMKHEKAPSHLVDLLQDMSSAPCRWRLVGVKPPLFLETKTIRMRSCIPEERNQRGDLWTMCGADGKESLEYRLFHIYPYATVKPSPPLIPEKKLSKRVIKKPTILTSPSAAVATKRSVGKSSELAKKSPKLSSPIASRLSEDDVQDLFAYVLYNEPFPSHLPFQVIPPGPHDLHVAPPPFAFADGLYVLIKQTKVPPHLHKHVMEYIPCTKCPWNLLETKLKQNPSARCVWKVAGPRYRLPSPFQMRCSISESGHSRGDVWTKYDAKGQEILECRLFHVYPATIMTAVKKPEITRKTVKKPSATKRTVKEAASLVSPSMLQSSVHAVTASLISPSVPRLSVEDVLEVFASVRNTRPPLPHLPFQVVPSGPHDVPITPPPYAFDDGLYVLMKPQTKKTPSHLLDYVLRVSPSTRLCRWKTRGPKYSQPSPRYSQSSLVQMRSCAPEVGHQRGDLWTMYDADGMEDFEYRLFHVFSNAVRPSPNAEKKQNEGCIKCGKDSDYDKLMICENCERECHTYCTGLSDVPEEDWFCDNCAPRMVSANGRRKRRPPAKLAQPAKKSSRISSMVTTESDLSEEPSASGSRARLPRSVAISPNHGERALPEHFFCKLTKRQIDASGNETDEPLGFVRLESRNATFSDTRAAIQEDMDPESLPGDAWKFYLPPIGPVSKRQEESFGSVSSFLLSQEFEGRLGDGSLNSPFTIYLLV